MVSIASSLPCRVPRPNEEFEESFTTPLPRQVELTLTRPTVFLCRCSVYLFMNVFLQIQMHPLACVLFVSAITLGSATQRSTKL